MGLKAFPVMKLLLNLISKAFLAVQSKYFCGVIVLVTR